jgi:hypothetical protein
VTAPRDRYDEVGRSTRAVLDAACTAADPLSAAEWRVLSAVLRETATWSRHVDTLSVDRISTLSGIASDRLVRTSLGALRDRGLIVYEARRGRPRVGERGRCRIGIPDVNALPLAASEPVAVPAQRTKKRHAGVPDTEPVAAAGYPARRGAGYPAEKRHPGVPLPEGFSREEEPPPSAEPPEPLTQSAILVAVPGGGGTSTPDASDVGAAVPAGVAEVLNTVAGALPLGSRDRALLADGVGVALVGGWEPEVLAAHLVADLPGPVRRPRGLLTHRLSGEVLPDGPAVCGCSACRRHVAHVDAEIRRQAAAMDHARQRATAREHDARQRYDDLTSALGAALHGRIVTAELTRERAAGPATPDQRVHVVRPTPARVRGLVSAVYADHGHDIDVIRAYAQTLPPGPSEMPAGATPTPTHREPATEPSTANLAPSTTGPPRPRRTGIA